ncbi:2-C-methyl-D-erythritol 4-phosphate cytidylyltransferase [Tepidibacillus decaturensis]|uniref:2-C-methyl-D-erythritol 4-phosphate cytidylyltransferase n=1 Tax=Tepidibacillus decaturensis TaxID=1413211 RepID=A0A135L7B0_9BACI|nr:2-C-methyl-D-erythritol 4-phosphate cytidylyltransferase [Tepidibacillus decaturensis]KXG44878.1 2-C-methyl-D-erythritol 4-phosphate cytidylyltransferase [Tepidibacillus decaturensis]
MKCGVLIPAAGQGKRMGLGFNKQFFHLNGKPILIHTLERFYHKPWIDEIILVVNPSEKELVQQLLREYHISVDAIVDGGAERQESIDHGLAFLHSEWVMVHDGARPFLKEQHIKNLIDKLQIFDAVVLGVPIKDTVKVIDESGIIINTPDRKSLWAIQTPQAFRLSILKEAYKKAKADLFIGTDDASLVERLGVKVHVLEGDYQNIKITTPEDLLIAKAISDQWSEEN